jgi:hypothetical protein
VIKFVVIETSSLQVWVVRSPYLMSLVNAVPWILALNISVTQCGTVNFNSLVNVPVLLNHQV